MVETVLKNKEEFIRRKKGVRSDADVTAQQLINIYRQLAVLGQEATQRYNQQLISQANSEVLSSLRVIPGGDEVREYHDFLTHTEIGENENSSDAQGDSLNKALPQAEELSPLWNTYGASTGTPLVVQGESERCVQPVVEHFYGGADTGKMRQILAEQVDKQKEVVKRVFENIIIDSNIEKMHESLKNAAEEIMQQLDVEKEKSFDSLSDFTVSSSSFSKSRDVPKNQERKKSSANTSYKKFYKKSDRKFSVDMSDEE